MSCVCVCVLYYKKIKYKKIKYKKIKYKKIKKYFFITNIQIQIMY
jgi:hypothetical protein